jgi:ribose transport system ATP-binding protein
VTDSADAALPAVVVQDLCKSFGAMRALDGVNLSIQPGTVTALVGENGAGKSTALGILAGRTAPTSGRVMVFGEELRHGDPRASRRAGVVAIYQELTVIPTLSAEANVFLADPFSRAGFLAEREMRARYLALCERVGVKPVPPHTQAWRLSVSEQQVLEILRALLGDARVILFDEPTASLAAPERAALLKLIKNLRKSGVTIVFVSHNLDEVMTLADTIAVFRDGRLRASGRRSDFTKASLVATMLGQAGDERVVAGMIEDGDIADPDAAERPGRAAAPARRRRHRDIPVLAAKGVTVRGAIEDVDVQVYAGEMVGIGGLVGSGRTTLLRALAGLEPTSTGRMWVDGREVKWPHTVRRSLKYGIALIPEDRKTQGLVMSMSVMDNIALSGFAAIARHGLVTSGLVERATADAGAAFGLAKDRLRDRAWQLSGGNQQKLLLARCKRLVPRILLADEPTRGIDVGAKAEILRSLELMAADGLGIVIVSSELEEVAAVTDSVIVLSEGVLAGTLERGTDQITPSAILRLAFQLKRAAA